YCATGYRASLAASLLQQEGFADVRNLPGSFHAWKAANFPVEK
ncbi:MAG: rhodanese-like domain-containing protein, partial [Verrucomicrobiota bacterium]|nr:rhodanese-like domain-containing protein [Verrucomicrobiota bacterium]